MDITPSNFLKLLGESNFFRGLTIRQAEELLTCCDRVILEPGQVLIKEGSVGQEMYILLLGKLSVNVKNRGVITTILPVNVIGEIGVLLDHPRAATVVAQEFSQLFKINRKDLFELFKVNNQIESVLYRNLCSILCERLAINNLALEDYRNK
jgi:CRP-like cAMP-binding protein